VHRILQKFTVALKMIDVIDKKQMQGSVIAGKEYTSKDWTCVISMFLTSFNVYFVCGFACFACIGCVSKLLSGFFGTRYGFFGEDRLATLLCSSARFDLANGVCASEFSHTPMLDCSYSTRH